jgi:hypothetical protein
LIVTSFASFSFLAKRAWTVEDSQAFSQVTRDLHASTMDSPRSPGDSDLYRAKLEREFERLSSKLAEAQDEPRRWSRWLLCTGAAVTAAGAVIHLARRTE